MIFVVFVLLHLYIWWQYIHGRVRLLFILSSTVCRLFCKYISVSMQVILSKFCIYIHQKKYLWFICNVCKICDYLSLHRTKMFHFRFSKLFFFLLAFLYWVILVYRDSYLILTILFKYWCLHVTCRIINGG